MENSVLEESTEGQDIDSFNDETFGEGATEGDWENSHYLMAGGGKGGGNSPQHDVMTGDAHGGTFPHVPGMHLHRIETESGQAAEEVLPDVAKLRIKELWPSSPQSNAQTDSIWSSPEFPTRIQQSPHIPPGTKIMSLEELERELTSSSPNSNTSSSMSPQPHSLPHPQSVSPTPSPAHHVPPPGIIQQPPPGLPRPLAPRPLHPMMPWPPHMQQRGMPPHSHQFHSMIPPPMVPILRRGILAPGHHLPPQNLQHLPPFPLHPQLPPPPQLHPLFQHHHQPNLMGPPPPRYKSKRSGYLDEMRQDGSGFMTQKEKDWVIKIQLVQLQTTDPENEDYYYQNYLKRKLQSKLSYSHHDSSSHDPEAPPSPTPSQSLPLPEFTARSYKPKEFQGALGKLSVSSIAAPRRTIDIPLSGEGAGKEVGVASLDTYAKKRQSLAIIEKLYSTVLVLEELEKKVFSVVDGEKQAQLLAKKDKLVAEVLALLKLKPPGLESGTRSDDAVFLMVTNYRKGKRVIKRILPFLNDLQACGLVLVFLRNLPSLVKKDSNDQILPELTVSLTSVLTSIDLEMATKCASAILEGPAASPASSLSSSASSIIRVCSSEFGAVLLLAVMKQGHKLASNHPDTSEDTKERWRVLFKRLYSTIEPHRAKLTSKSTPSTDQMLKFFTDLL